MPRKNILFDWSGTLSDDFNMVYETAMQVFERLGGTRMPIEQFRMEIVLPYMDFYRGYFPNLDEDHQRELFSEIFVTMDNPTLFEGADSFLEGLASQGMQMAVLSAHHPPGSVESLLASLE
ncbi:MAG: HAD hydrolase-like protein [Nanoarchaeota archaeon]